MFVVVYRLVSILLMLPCVLLFVAVFDSRATLHLGVSVFFFQAEDGIRYLVRSRGLGDVYKRQLLKALTWGILANA